MLVIQGSDRASDVGAGLASQIKEMRRFLRFTAHLSRQRIRGRDACLMAARGGRWA
jgi:hypothetical protein